MEDGRVLHGQRVLMFFDLSAPLARRGGISPSTEIGVMTKNCE
jgi:hypothetical protein